MNNIALILYRLTTIFFVLFFSIVLTGCGGSSNNTKRSSKAYSSPTQTPEPTNNTAPVLTLLGQPLVSIGINDNYHDEGALALDSEDGNISTSITTTGIVNVAQVGDYMITYKVTDSMGKSSQTISRIVRVYDYIPAQQTMRQSEINDAPLSYLEHLPANYSANNKAPLIIFNHGSGATNTNNLSDVECCGLPRIIKSGPWDNELSFVILSPQRNIGLDIEKLNQFMEYAIRHYNIDQQRIYMTGWSQGGLATMLYALAYPEQLAAISVMATGFFQGAPASVCSIDNMPIWMFLGEKDSSFINGAGQTAVNEFMKCGFQPEPRLTTYLEGDHFLTSIWPFLSNEEHDISPSSDTIEQSLFSWFLQFSRNNSTITVHNTTQ